MIAKLIATRNIGPPLTKPQRLKVSSLSAKLKSTLLSALQVSSSIKHRPPKMA
jgi:hypothetical protein